MNVPPNPKPGYVLVYFVLKVNENHELRVYAIFVYDLLISKIAPVCANAIIIIIILVIDISSSK